LLQGRPDILAGQLKIYAQAHRINASRLNLYPSLNLNLSGIGMSSDLSDGFEQWKFSGGPVIDLPILSPRRRTQLRIDEATLKMIGLEWKATLIGAVKEIETATIKHQSSANDFKISQNLVDEFMKSYEISDQKFQAGLISKIDFIQDVNRLNESKRTSLNYRNNYWKSFLILSEGLGINWLE
jgi:outer membrane protein TolC